ncbi:hypothetical protein Tco_0934006 [Tanacetum coccineum]
MALPSFNEIVTALIDHDPFFHSNMDCAGRQGISGLLECTSAIRQLAYDVHADFLDEYIQISERTSRTALDHFCQADMQIYGPEFLRKPTVTDIEKLYLHHEEKHRNCARSHEKNDVSASQGQTSIKPGTIGRISRSERVIGNGGKDTVLLEGEYQQPVVVVSIEMG